MPPPNVTGALHMGHAMFAALQDAMARFQRMRGRPVLWLPGTDHAGIATQAVVERALEADGLSREGVGRAAFEERAWAWKGEFGGRITQQLRALGCSCDWSRERFTLDQGLSAAVAQAFTRLHADGLVYRGTYMVNWSPGLGTAVSDLEVEYSEEEGGMHYFRYPLVPLPDVGGGGGGGGGGDDDVTHLPVATTRPETILGDTAVAVNPEDPRWARFVGRECEVPFLGRRIPVVGDAAVDVDLGTGCLKVTPAHDPTDREIGLRHDLPVLTVIGRDGAMNAAAGARFAGLDRADARGAVWEGLQELGLADRVETITTRVPRAQRGGEVIEPMVSEQWFVRTAPLARPALEAVRSGATKIIPPRFEAEYERWLGEGDGEGGEEGLRDWCVSRQLWWGHRIPVWYVYPDRAAAEAGAAGGRNHAGHPDFVVATDEAAARAQAAEQFPELAEPALAQDEDVLDTWFSSGLWPFSSLGWPEQTADLERFYPTAVLETGHDILFFWVARMMMMGTYLTGEAPFHTVYLHGLVRDAQGRKMSKSLGNVVDPLEAIKEYSADALRFALLTGTSPGQDLSLDPERMVSARSLSTKVWNAAKFTLRALEGAESGGALEGWEGVGRDVGDLPLAEAWLLSRLHEAVDAAIASQEKLAVGEAGRALSDFFWGDFADWYVEAAKPGLMSGEGSAARVAAQRTLRYATDHVLRLLHPFMPFVTEELWQALPGNQGKQLIAEAFPEAGLPRAPEKVAHFEALRDTVKALRNARGEHSVEGGKKLQDVRVCVADGDLQAALEGAAPVLAALGRVDPASLSLSGPAGEAVADDEVLLVVRDGLEVRIPLASLADVEKETKRLAKQATKLEKELGELEGRLGSANFVEKAPAKIVQEAQDRAAELREQLSAVRQRQDQMAALAR